MKPRPQLRPDEADAVRELVHRLRERGWPPLLHAALFGSKARGDFDDRSDLDVLLVCDVDPADRTAAGAIAATLAARVSAETGVRLEPWAVCAADLAVGRRTPMLVDAVADSIPVWPADDPPLRAPFTPADAVFCAGRLLEWVNAGGAEARRALREGRVADAARRARDDMARLATAALLLNGDTRHRRLGSLMRFERVFVRGGIVPPTVRPALAWAAAAYPRDGGRGQETPPVTDTAISSAAIGCELAALLERELVARILDRIAQLVEAMTSADRTTAARKRRAAGWRPKGFS